eukprot:m.14636 g.14636  ORF g.14636 m.14636 type:complete len:324 (-) comp4346_c0_seq1:858-1829(-)
MSSDNDEVYVPFAKRDEWRDIEPIKQDDGPNPACPILYSPEYVDAMDYFRAILKSQEMSERALQLTTEIIAFNPAHYTVWHYRRKLLDSIDADLREELCYISRVIEENIKNYQVWHHRQEIATRLNDPSAEMEFTKQMLRQDAKNYHAWTYRQWALTHFNLFGRLREDGLGYVNDLLEDDIFNNSAWNHRHFVITKTKTYTEDIIDEEVDFTLDKVTQAPNNEASINYLRGIIKHSSRPARAFEKAVNVCTELSSEDTPSPLVLAFLLFVNEDTLKGEDDATEVEKACAFKTANKLCDRLCEIDSIRKKFWRHKQNCLHSRIK